LIFNSLVIDFQHIFGSVLLAFLAGGGGAALRKWGGIALTRTSSPLAPTCAKPLALICSFLPLFQCNISLIFSDLCACFWTFLGLFRRFLFGFGFGVLRGCSVLFFSSVFCYFSAFSTGIFRGLFPCCFPPLPIL